MKLPGLYAIADAGALTGFAGGLEGFAEGLLQGGAELVQWRAKSLQPRAVLDGAAVLRRVLSSRATLIMNDRADLSLLAGFDGVHVGQDDLAVEDARRVLSVAARMSPVIVGISTHTRDELAQAEATSADYLAVGPVFATGSKADASPVIGLDGLRRARALTGKPLVAIGGITRANARSVIAAGADSLAVISGLLVPGEPVEKVTRDFLDLFR